MTPRHPVPALRRPATPTVAAGTAIGLVAAVLTGLTALPSYGGAVEPPDAVITTPAGQDTLHPVSSGGSAGAISFQGTATGAASVQIAIQDRASRLWWRSDGTWGDQQRLATTVSGSTASAAWSAAWAPPGPGDYAAQVFARDATGTVDPSPAFVRFGVVALPGTGGGTGRTDPAAAVAHPAQDQVLRAGTALTARGLAADDTGVASVGVAVQDRTTKLWWHADRTWGSYVRHAATLADPGAVRTEWRLTWTPPADGDYAFQVIARDAGGATDPDVPYRRFAADGTAPTAAVTDGGGQDRSYPAGRAVTWSGTAADARGVADVLVAVQDRATRLWWQADGTWGAFARHRAALTGPSPGTGGGTAAWSVAPASPGSADGDRWSFTGTGWSFTWTPPREGDFGVQVTAVDGAGRPAAALPWVRFTATAPPADDTAPEAAFTAPVADRTYTAGPVRITGTATDDVAVGSLYLGILDRATGRWWQPGGGWGTAYRRLTTATTGLGTRTASWSYDWAPPAGDGRYLVHVEAIDTAGGSAVNKATGTGRPSVTFGLRPGAAGTAYTSLVLSRSQWTAVDHQCRALRGAVPLDEVATELTRRGIRATGTIVVDRSLDGGRACTANFTDYANWTDLAGLRDRHGWSFVSHGATYANMTTLTAEQQRAESCGSLAGLTAHGHIRAWGLFAYPNNKYTAQIQRDVVATCFGYGRTYGTGRNRRPIAAPHLQSTSSWPSGLCNDPALTCHAWAPNLSPVSRYTSPAALAAMLTSGADEWQVVQGYKFLRGRRVTGPNQGQQWDCTGADWRARWTSSAESYCLTDLLAALDTVRGTTFTDPATVAETWGRPRPS